MLEVLAIVAQLCQISGGPNPTMVAAEQAQCHKYYVRCLTESSNPEYDKRLVSCILGKTSSQKGGR